MDPQELLELIAPSVAGMDAGTVEKALSLAERYRPACLTPAKQDEAQALYAAWILYNIKQQEAGGGIVAPLGAARIKEDRLEVSFSEGGAVGNDDPMGFYSRWQALNRLCSLGGAIIAGTHYDHGHR